MTEIKKLAHKKKTLFLTLLFISTAIIFQGCSWVNHFYIYNHSLKEITVEIQLKDSINAIPLFYTAENTHVAYTAKSNGGPEYDSPASFKKIKLENNFHFKISILPNTTLQIGALYNDKYTSYNQHFINGRFFNLVSLIIIKGDAQKIIKASEFDAHLKKISGDFVVII